MKVYFNPSLLIKLDILSSEYDSEIGGYLTGEVKNGKIILTDLLLPSQIVSSTSVTINPKDQIELLKKYGHEKCKKIIGHWHSHARMGCFWSGTDMNNMNGIMENKELFVFIVSSLKRHLVRVCLRNPLHADFENVEYEMKSLSLDLFRKKVDSIFSLSKERNDEQKYNFAVINNINEDEENNEDDEDDETEEERRKRLEGEDDNDGEWKEPENNKDSIRGATYYG
jgi:proteasome lid subunit RPN8/RPN11